MPPRCRIDAVQRACVEALSVLDMDDAIHGDMQMSVTISHAESMVSSARVLGSAAEWKQWQVCLPHVLVCIGVYHPMCVHVCVCVRVCPCVCLCLCMYACVRAWSLCDILDKGRRARMCVCSNQGESKITWM